MTAKFIRKDIMDAHFAFYAEQGIQDDRLYHMKRFYRPPSDFKGYESLSCNARNIYYGLMARFKQEKNYEFANCYS